jgi:hypothetical protein
VDGDSQVSCTHRMSTVWTSISIKSLNRLMPAMLTDPIVSP